MALDDHYGNPAALVFPCEHCGSPPGAMCTGAERPPVYRTFIHKAREDLLKMPEDEPEWDRRMRMVRQALGVA